MEYKYTCTGNITINGFGDFLEENIKEARRNINLFSNELRASFNIPFISLVNSGSSANLAAAMVMAEKIKSQGKPLKAIVSAFTFPTTMSSLILAGFEIEMADVEKGGLNIDPEKLREKMNGVSLVVPTHFLGFPARIKQITEIAREHGAFVIQDACETMHLLDDDNNELFTYGDITTWSFYHPHHLSSYGGGAIITLNQDDAMLVDSICHWGRACKCHIDPSLCKNPDGPAHQFTYERVGVNIEISELNACFGRWQFQNFDKYEEQRKANYQCLYDTLSDNKNLKVFEHPNIGGSVFVFPVYLKNGMTVNDAYKKLSAQGVEIRTLMGGVTNEQKAYRFISDEIFTNAHDMAEHTFFIGIHQTIPYDNAKAVAEIINKTFS